MSQLGAHEWSAAQEAFAHPPSTATNSYFREINQFDIAWAQIEASSVAENWRAVLEGQGPIEAQVLKNPGFRSQLPTSIMPLLALAKAHLGRVAEAERDIAPTPGDCDPCLIARAQLSELQGEYARANYWFGRAVGNAPSIPFADHEWGRALLARGKPDEAIGKFKMSNQKGPHFADPLEGWGEALMAKNQSHLALERFADAKKYAPNWGRLHLKWGEALAYAGRKNEAKAQFARAAQLDLTPSEKSELARVGTTNRS
jgi:tetratricopeptide (TPR) repeat protein